MKILHVATMLLLIVGGLNWLLVGLMGWDIGQLFGGQGELIPRIIYVLVGLAAIWEICTHKKNCRACSSV